MRLLIEGRVLKHRYTTGVERYVRELLRAFDKSRLKYDLVLPFGRNNKYFQHIWEHIYLPLKGTHYDILFCPANIAPVIKPKALKLIITIHDLSYMYFPDAYSFTFRKYYGFIIPKVLNLADAIITVSHSEKEALIKYFPSLRNKIYPIYLGVKEEFLNCPLAHEKEKFILYVGSLNKRKNLMGLIKAFKILINKIPHKLVIVGIKGDSFKKIEITKILKDIPSERLIFMGQIENNKRLMELYRRCYLFVFPSLYEGFGLPPLEAMACGCPVVVSNVSALPEICGDAAYYVNPYNINSIAEGIKRVLDNKDLREELIKKGLNRAKAFSWEKTAQEYLEIFHKVLENK